MTYTLPCSKKASGAIEPAIQIAEYQHLGTYLSIYPEAFRHILKTEDPHLLSITALDGSLLTWI